MENKLSKHYFEETIKSLESTRTYIPCIIGKGLNIQKAYIQESTCNPKNKSNPYRNEKI